MQIPPTCNQLKFNTCKAKVSCMFTLLNPKTKHLAGHAITKYQAPSQFFLDFSKQLELPRNSLALIFHGSTHTNQKFAPYFTPFLLRKELGSSLESFSQVHRFTHQKKDKTDLISYSHFLKETRRLKNSLKLSTFHTLGSSHSER